MPRLRLHQAMTAFSLLVMLSAALAQPVAQPGGFAITGVSIIDVAATVEGDALKTNQTVVATERLLICSPASCATAPGTCRRSSSTPR